MGMGEPGPAEAANLARAGTDLHARRQLIADNLERLLAGLQKLRSSTSVPPAERDRQIGEGMELAVKLSDMLRQIAEQEAKDPSAP
jgi:hypothetical protein